MKKIEIDRDVEHQKHIKENEILKDIDDHHKEVNQHAAEIKAKAEKRDPKLKDSKKEQSAAKPASPVAAPEAAPIADLISKPIAQVKP